MANFVRVKDGTVVDIIFVTNDNAPDEQSGIAFIASVGIEGEWVQTSYNANPVGGVDRGPFAGIGYGWDGLKFTPPADDPTALPPGE
jgi:hypothetical protein